MNNQFKLITLLILGFSTIVSAQNSTPDFSFSLGKTNYFMLLTKGNAKSKNDTVFYNLYRMGKTQRIAKEIKHVVNRTSGDTVKSGSYETKDHQIFFYLKEKSKPTILRLYTQNEKGLLSLKTGISNFVAPQLPAPFGPVLAYDNSGHPEKVDVMAEFPGGINKVREFIAKNLRYPEEAQENEVEATARVKFVVEKDGSVTNIQLEKKLGYGFDEEVMRIFKRMPKWKPALLKGHPVRSQFAMPISFRTH
ncbi:energy transducer TonB [Pedobacter lithocola]|uniref:Energy transducer TonB n=1 Tax=Pedobacter lithocola TaxID=1908239 RepID=A0ABV8PCM3_9SPHI